MDYPSDSEYQMHYGILHAGNDQILIGILIDSKIMIGDRYMDTHTSNNPS